MGLWQVGVELVFMLAFGLSVAQWHGTTPNREPVIFKLQTPVQALKPSESRMPQVPQSYEPNNPLFTPQRIPFKIPVQMPVQDPMGVQSKQLLQGPVEKLTWTFPILPQEQEQPDIPFQLRQPVPANSVAAQCGENSIYVEVKEDFFGTGKLLMASAFTLGGCTAVGEDNTAQVLIFESELHGCGSIPKVTENELVYMFSLIYTPQEALLGVPVVGSAALVGIECHYPRMQNVSSSALMPSWMPYAATGVAEDILVLSLRLMTDDWRFERPSNQYFLGDFINIEASVMSYNHVPVRVFVDSCLATSAPDLNTTPRYTFIVNNGCLVDAKITGSSSHFMPRMSGDKLQFQLEAFRFQQLNSGLVYITCILKVAAAFNPTNPEQKACSFSANGWVSADESDQVCSCCDANCSIRIGGDQPVNDLQWQKATVGPVNVKDRSFGQM